MRRRSPSATTNVTIDRIVVALILLLITFAAAARAQDSDSGITALKKREATAVAGNDRGALQRLFFALLSLEMRRASSGDYAGAQRAKEEANVLEQSHGPFRPDREGQRITLGAAGARTTGAIRVGRGNNVLVGWKHAGNEAAWDVRAIKPGTYDVVATYGVADNDIDPATGRTVGAGGTFIVRQATSLAGDAPERITHKVSSTGGWNDLVSIKCGQMSFQRTSATIVVECASAEAAGLMHLKKLELSEVSSSEGGHNIDVEARFSALQVAHDREVDKLLAPIEKKYLKALNAFSVDSNTKEDVERLRAELTARHQADDVRDIDHRSSGKEVVLSAIDNLSGFVSGAAAIHSSGNYVTGLRPPDGYVQWSLEELGVPPGEYVVVAEFRTAEKMGGKFRLVCGSEKVLGSLRVGRTGGAINRSFRTQRLGRLRISSAARTIRFEAAELDRREGTLCDLRRIVLKPVGSSKTRTKHPDGYVEWTGATFSESIPSMGDRFGVRHDGRIHRLRLYAVTCPPGSTRVARKEELSGARDHFGVSPKDLARAGRQATQFTETILKQQSFSVFTMGAKSTDGFTYAWIVVDGGALLSALLVENGLAIIDGEDGALPEVVSSGVDAAAFDGWLRVREDEARDRKEGVWRYRRQ